MPRPPKNQKGPSATTRMENAFWHMLEQKPFSKITVSDIVKEAQVNRNAFYYHHESITDLANKAVQRLILDEGPSMITEIIKTNGTYLDEILSNSKRNELLKRIRLIAGSHSSPELTDMLKDAITSTWFTSFDVDKNKLEPTANIIIVFAIGGLAEILGKWEIGEKGITPKTFVKSGMATTIAKLVSQALYSAAGDKEKIEELCNMQLTRENSK